MDGAFLKVIIYLGYQPTTAHPGLDPWRGRAAWTTKDIIVARLVAPTLSTRGQWPRSK